MFSPDTSVSDGAELDAVNEILAAIGEPPVITLDDETNADVSNAQRILSKINRQIQSRGWTFNIEEGATLTPDLNTGLIPYSPNYLSLLSTGGTTTYVNRSGYIYDKSAATDEFTGALQVNLVVLKDYDEMPECFRSWIVAKASRQFNSRFFGAPEVEASLAEEERDAQMRCFEYELDFGQYNMLDGDAFVQGILTR